MKNIDFKKPRFSSVIDDFIQQLSNILSWLCIVLIFVIMFQVVMRYVFGRGSVLLEELQWHLFGMSIMLALCDAMTQDRNIRLDIFRDNFSDKKKEYIEIFGILFFVFPMIFVIFWHSLSFVHESWRLGECSNSPMGLPCRWLIKSMIPVSMALLCIASVSRLVRSFAFLKWTRYQHEEGQ